MEKSFPLQEVIDDLVDTNKSISAPLIKLNYFGKLIKNSELIEYTKSELNGYLKKEEVPSYRKTLAILYITIQGFSSDEELQLPISMLDEELRNAFEFFCVQNGIATIEKVAKETENDSSGKQLMRPLPMEMLPFLREPARKLYKSNFAINIVRARLAASSNIIFEIPNAIRTKLLDFVMSIADTFGYDIEIESFNKKSNINNQTINYQMNTTINNSGDANIINTGNENQIESNAIIYKGDLIRLQSELRGQGIDEADVNEISEIVSNEEPNKNDNRLGEKSNAWISKIINKSLNGIGKIATGISANLLAGLIKHYYGMA
jgi:hypothetical protein